MENGWMDWIEWMWKVDVESGAVPDLTLVYVEDSHSVARKAVLC